MWAASKPKNLEDRRRLFEAIGWETYKTYHLKRRSLPGEHCPSPIWETQHTHCLIRRAEASVCLNEPNASSCVRTKFTTTVPGTPAFSAKIKSLGH